MPNDHAAARRTPASLTSALVLVLVAATGDLLAQNCDHPPQSIPTRDPFAFQYFFGPGATHATTNLFCDLNVQVPIRIDGFVLPVYAQGVDPATPYQIGNLAQVRIYLIPTTRIGHELSPAGWGLTPPGGGGPDAIGELLVQHAQSLSPVRNVTTTGAGSSPLIVPAGQWGLCLELIPTSWNGTPAIPGQTKIPLLSPGPLHVIGGLGAGSSTASDPYVTLSNDIIQSSGWQSVNAAGVLQPSAAPVPGSSDLNLRIDYTPLVPGLAAATSYGSGCHDSPRLVYERFPPSASTLDLANTTWTLDFLPDVRGSRYRIQPSGLTFDSATAIQNGASLLAMQPTVSTSWQPWDDGTLVYPLPTARFPTGLPFPGGTCQTITINSNGIVYLGDVQTPESTWPTNGDVANLLTTPQLLPFAGNIIPGPASELRLEDPSPNGGIRITWFDMPSPVAASDFQIELLPNGDVTFAYGPRLNNDQFQSGALVGFVPGGEPITYPIDWSAITSFETGTGTRSPRLSLAAPPVLGTTLTTVVDQLGPTTLQPIGGVLAIGLAGLPTGVPLAVLGLPDCSSHLDIGQLLLFEPLPNLGTGDLRWSTPIPLGVGGQQFHMQAITFTPNLHNATGWLLSSGLCVQLGM